MTRVVQPGAVVSDRKLLDLLDRSRVVNGYSGVIAKSMQEEHLLLAETFHGAVDELDDAQYPVFRLQRHADDGPGLPLRHLINALGKSGIVVNIGHNQ